MTGKWVQAENAKDEKLDVFVWVEAAERTTGTASSTVTADERPALLGPDGKPLASVPRRRVGFGDPRP